MYGSESCIAAAGAEDVWSGSCVREHLLESAEDVVSNSSRQESDLIIVS